MELFPGIGEVVSGSVFYKALTDAIEQVVKPSASLGSERTFVNSEKAKTYGFELEGRKSLSFIGEYFGNFSLNLNYSWIRSEVNFDPGVAGIETRSRPLQGQSDFVVNAGLTFTEPDLGTSFGVYFNRFGDRISEVSTTQEPDVVEQGQKRRRLRARPEHRPDGRHQALGEGRPPRVAGVRAGRQGREEGLQGHGHRPRNEREVLNPGDQQN